jgi:hypothetical protein
LAIISPYLLALFAAVVLLAKFAQPKQHAATASPIMPDMRRSDSLLTVVSDGSKQRLPSTNS